MFCFIYNHFCFKIRRPAISTLFPYTTLFRSFLGEERVIVSEVAGTTRDAIDMPVLVAGRKLILVDTAGNERSEEHTSELQSPMYLVCRLLLEKKKHKLNSFEHYIT